MCVNGSIINEAIKEVNHLKVMYTNADQFLNKKDELVEFITGNEPSIIMITEIIPKAQVHPIEAPSLKIHGYNVHLNFEIADSNLGASGIRGVAIYVKEDMDAEEVTFNTVFADHLRVEIPLAKEDSLLCGCVYRSPTKEKEATIKSTTQVCDLISEATGKNHSHLLICGDFNYPEIDWENESVGENSDHLASFMTKIQDCLLHQHITESTRFRFGEEPSLLDLILTTKRG